MEYIYSPWNIDWHFTAEALAITRSFCQLMHGDIEVTSSLGEGSVFTVRLPALLREDIWVINSFSKYFQMTGWRLGWMVIPDAYVRDVEKLAQNLTLCPSLSRL